MLAAARVALVFCATTPSADPGSLAGRQSNTFSSGKDRAKASISA